MTSHAKLGPSSAHRWLRCPGSIAATAELPNTSSAAADEGTCAHELAELCLINNVDAEYYLNKPLIDNNHHTVEQSMCDYVQQYVDYVRSLSGQHTYEMHLDISDWAPGGFGTADAVIINGNTAHVVDLKYGRSQVDAENNEQLMLYALGVFAEYNLVEQIDSFVLVINQPRLDHLSEWTILTTDLLAWGEGVILQAEEALSDDAPRNPGEKQCHWCAAKPTCVALKRHAEEVLLTEFEELTLTDQGELTLRQLTKVLDSKKLITGWLDAVENRAKELLLNGESFPGYKIVEGRSVRRWADEKTVVPVLGEVLGDSAYEKKLLSPAKAEKALGKTKKHVIQEFIIKPNGAPTLVPESDKRQAINISKDEFTTFD